MCMIYLTIYIIRVTLNTESDPFSLWPHHAQMAESELLTLVCPFTIWPGPFPCGFPNIGISQKSGFHAFSWISGHFFGDFKCPWAPDSLATLDKILWEAVKSGVACIGCKCGQCLKSIYFAWNPNFCVKSPKKREIPITGKTTWEGLR